MSEIILLDPAIPEDISRYGRNLGCFIAMTSFPEELLEQPDNVMIKASDPKDFETRYQSLAPWVAERPYFVDVPDGRFLVAARLLTPLAVFGERRVDWVELMEAKRADAELIDYVGAEYTEFFTDDLKKAGKTLRERGIAYKPLDDGDHAWLNMRINTEGQELRITDRMLAETIDEELDTERARPLT
jgi:hypothetical protein